jgi:hypothetical protein
VRLLDRANASLLGNVIFWELIFSVPMSLLSMYLNYDEGTLTLHWGIWIIGSCAAAGPVLAVLYWFTFRPLLRVRRKPRNDG